MPAQQQPVQQQQQQSTDDYIRDIVQEQVTRLVEQKLNIIGGAGQRPDEKIGGARRVSNHFLSSVFPISFDMLRHTGFVTVWTRSSTSSAVLAKALSRRLGPFAGRAWEMICMSFFACRQNLRFFCVDT